MRFFLIVSFLFLVASCSTEPLRSYILTPAGPAPAGGGAISLGIGPITAADYLQRLEIPVQTGENELEYAFEHLWAGTVESQMTTVVGTNLGRELNTGKIAQYPWPPSASLDHIVEIEVRRLHSTVGGEVIFEAGWQIYGSKPRVLKRSGTYSTTLAFTGEGFKPATKAKSRAVELMCREIASVIRSL